MPSRVIICPKNEIDLAVLTASPSVIPTLPVGNLQIPARGRIMRSTSAATQDIKWTWNGAGHRVNVVMISRHNLEPGSTWDLNLYSTSDWSGSPIYTASGLVTTPSIPLGSLDWGVAPLGAGTFDSLLGQRFSIHIIPATYTALSGRVTLNDTGNSHGYLEMSRLFAGQFIELSYNPDSIDFAWDEETSQSRSAGGSLRSDGRINFRTIDMTVNFVSSGQRAELADALRWAGRRKDVLLCAFPEDGDQLLRDYTGLFRFTGTLPRLRMTGGRDPLSANLSFAEV